MVDCTFIRDETRTAIKKHRCYLCRRHILPGEKYLRRVLVSYENEIFASPMHIRCVAHTKSWDELDWMFHDVGEFRKDYDNDHTATETAV